MTQKPELYAPDLTEERLYILSENLIDVLDEAHHYSESPNATAWFKGTANYGLPQGMLIRMHSDNAYPCSHLPTKQWITQLELETLLFNLLWMILTHLASNIA